MKKIIFAFLTSVLALIAAVPTDGCAANAPRTSKFKVEGFRVAHIDTSLRISFFISPSRIKPGKDNQVIFTPVIRGLDNSADSVTLPSVTVAGRNRYYTRLRNGDIEYGDLIYKAGKKGSVSYDHEVLWQPWMENAEVIIREETQNCCRPIKPLTDTSAARINTTDGDIAEAVRNVEYIALTGDETIEMEAQGSAYIDFLINSIDIIKDYRNNPAELKKITESIDIIRNDPDAIITRLTIKGFASPEGPYENNVRLAMGRTEALKEYIRTMYDFDPEIMFTTYEPEDWNGLRSWLEKTSIPNRDNILRIVDSDLAPDDKDREIKTKYPAQYKTLLNDVYPALRHSDYTVRYKIKTYVDIEELKKVYTTTPQRLRPVDFYRLAKTYPEGSADFETILLKASEIYPHDQQAAVNAANILMKRGEIEAASEKISYAGETGEAYYTRGMLALVNRDFDRAETLMNKALEMGVEKAQTQLDMIDRYRPHENVTYMLEESIAN